MKIQKRSVYFFLRTQIVFALAGIFLISDLRAQPAAQPVENRLLFVFDTSSAMKKRLPAEEMGVNQLFALALNKQLQPGDSIGVWTFGRDLQTGQFPLQPWEPQKASTISSNILEFVKKQHYSKTTRFDKLMPLLDNVVSGSERLTTLIFCDGDGQIVGTPFDDSINAAFKQNQRAMKKARQPFVIVLRSQLGQYVNFTINPAKVIEFPQFPPLPQPPAPTNAAPPPKPPALPPLIIIGTTVTNHLPPPPPAPEPAPPPLTNQTTELSNSTSAVSAPPTNLALATNAEAASPTNSVSPTNTLAPSPKNSGMSSGDLLGIGAGLLIAAATLIVLILRRPRKTDSPSLITRSMKKD